MALLFYDSFDHYTTVTQKWTDSSSFGGSLTISSSYGRHDSGLGMIGNIMQTGADPTRVRKLNLPTIDHSMIVGFALRFNGSGRTLARGADPFFSIYNGSTEEIRLHFENFYIEAYRKDGTLLGSTTRTFHPNQWHYFEVKALLAGAGTGTLDVRHNGVNVLSFAGNTSPAGSIAANGFLLGGVRGDSFNGFNMDAYYDDVYAANTSGTAHNDFVGDLRLVAIFPEETGTYAQWLPVPDTGTNWQLVDENPPNNDTDYVHHSGTGIKDSYTFQDISGTVTVNGVQVNAVAAITSGTYRIIEPMVRTSGTDSVNEPTGLTSATYRVAHASFGLDPADDSAWTPTKVNDAEFGVKTAG